MNKRIVQILLFSVLAIAITACGADAVVPRSPPEPVVDSEASSNKESVVETAVPKPTVEPVVEESETVVDEQPTEMLMEVESETAVSETNDFITFQLEAWADNWFAAYLGEELIIEDSVSINTERSFNAETTTFEASYPLTLNFILKDFKENDTGLEYIGSPRQQMGDGGFILQLTDMNLGDVVAVSNEDWACTVIHEAPLDKSCENESNPVAGTPPCAFINAGEPDGWKSADYDDGSWTDTTVHTANDVSPKDGYDQIRWDASAELIWGSDLETNNTILCRVTVDAP